MLDFDAYLWRGGIQNALFKIAAKQYLRLLMMLDFDTWFWRLILTLDFDTWFWCLILMLDFDAWFWCLILTLDFEAWFWGLILTLEFDTWLLILIYHYGQTDRQTHNANARVASRQESFRSSIYFWFLKMTFTTCNNSSI